MVTPAAPPLDPSKLIILIIFDSLRECEALGDILTSVVSNPPFGKGPGARDMTILGSHFLPHVSESVTLYVTI